ncbi:MAG: hypothetical protein GKR89_28915 [Candidatus Latescibacteria bacterium]|nr:hypothetical protein [Candidatus Latescibacterota bacterium]
MRWYRQGALWGGLALLFLLACGPKAVKSPRWILDQPAHYPPEQFLIGVGSAPTDGGLADALEAAAISARAEIAQTIEVRIEHVEELDEQSSSVRRSRQGKIWTLEVERSNLSSFTRVSTDEQIIRGIEVKEKYHDRKRRVLYVLAVLSKAETGERLTRELAKLDEQVEAAVEQARRHRVGGDWLAAVRLYREGLNLSLQSTVLKNRLGVVAPRLYRLYLSTYTSDQLALELDQLFHRLYFRVDVEADNLVRDTMHEALVDAGFNVRAQAGGTGSGLTLWGDVTQKWDTSPRLEPSPGDELQVCRLYLGIKIVDDHSGAIIGQVNLLANSNASNRQQAQERTVRLLRQRILDELPQEVYQALSIEK